ncbi:hypothetical protein K0M31_009548 [Melipona bicolor]|uniref:Peptidase M13 N-terminal domain-containing protein n=1 Tax=Melipona bicolor TaxID=60889 RepID=A0AA40FNA7_9HYME|nr:hypothetical protein K0M31_009548 [Melipona bicolor]
MAFRLRSCETARRILTNMNASADPCVDFYEYACGNWSRNKSDAIWNIRAVANSEIKRRVRGKHPQSMNKRGMQPLLSILDGIGGWPTGRNESEQKWQNIDDYYAHLSGFHSLHDVWVATYGPVHEDESAVLDIPDTPPYSRNILSEFFNTNGNLTFSTMGYWSYSMRIVSEIAESERFRVTEDELEEDMEEIFNFELKLMQISSEDTRKDYVNMTVREFQGWYDSFNPRTENARVNWVDKLIGNFRESGINITEDMMLKVASPIYYEKLVSLLDETPSRIVEISRENLQISKFPKKNPKTLPLDYDIDSPPSKIRIAHPTRNPKNCQIIGIRYLALNPTRWWKVEQRLGLNLCIKEPRLTAVVAYEYARRYFPDDMMKMTLNVFDDVEEEMKIEIKESNWANKEIKDLALRKVKSIKKNIVYPDWYNNATIMENYFGKLAMGPTYFENSLRFQRYHKLKDLRLLKHKDAVKS